MLCLGDFVTDGARRHPGHGSKGPLHRFGMDDAATASLLREAAAAGTLPDFAVAYCADNDYRSHEVGPAEALPVLDRVDQALGETYDAAGGIDRLLADTVVIVTSDHGHCEVLDDRERPLSPLTACLVISGKRASAPAGASATRS